MVNLGKFEKWKFSTQQFFNVNFSTSLFDRNTFSLH